MGGDAFILTLGIYFGVSARKRRRFDTLTHAISRRRTTAPIRSPSDTIAQARHFIVRLLF